MRRRRAPAWPLAFLLPVLAGCLTAESTLRPDGSGTIEMTYRTPPDATEFLEARRYSSPHVHVESVKIYESQRTVLRATVDDVTKLDTAKGFEHVRVTRARDGADERLDIHLLNPAPKPVERERTPWMRIGLTVPGPIRKANHDGVVDGGHVAWSVTRSDFARNADTVLTVRWRPPAAG